MPGSFSQSSVSSDGECAENRTLLSAKLGVALNKPATLYPMVLFNFFLISESDRRSMFEFYQKAAQQVQPSSHTQLSSGVFSWCICIVTRAVNLSMLQGWLRRVGRLGHCVSCPLGCWGRHSSRACGAGGCLSSLSQEVIFSSLSTLACQDLSN